MTRSNICLLSDVSIFKKGGSVVAYVLTIPTGQQMVRFVTEYGKSQSHTIS